MTSHAIAHEFLFGWQNKIHLFDIYQNLLFYIPFGFLLAFSHSRFHIIWRLILCFICAIILSTTLELLQSFHATRVSSLLDVALNTLSSVVGGIFGCILTMRAIAWHKLHFQVFKTEQNKFLSVTAMMLIIVGVAYHLYPYLPTLQYAHLKTGVKPLLLFWDNPNLFHTNQFIKYFMQGILLYCAGFFLLRPKIRIVLLLFLIAAISSLKIVIISRYISIESLSGLTSAVLLGAMSSVILTWIRCPDAKAKDSSMHE